jgi:hypothetical protein
LKQAMVQQVRHAYVKRLREEANTVVQLSAPRVNVAYDPPPVRGNVDAPVAIVEFSDDDQLLKKLGMQASKRIGGASTNQAPLISRTDPRHEWGTRFRS